MSGKILKMVGARVLTVAIEIVKMTVQSTMLFLTSKPQCASEKTLYFTGNDVENKDRRQRRSV